MRLQGPFFTALAFTLWAIVHSLLASLGAKQKARDGLGLWGERAYRLFYNLFSGVTFLPLLAIPLILPGETLYRMPWPWTLLTGALQLAGALIILIGMLQTDIWHFMGLRQMLDRSTSPESPLVVGGLYRYMRHPLYTGGLLLIWFAPIMTASLLAFNLAATLYLYIGSLFEERRLIREFGDAYRDYRSRVPRFFPRPNDF
jgi:protein-S-isoprenylcysteine O-methyltransferase Ste14